MTWSFHGSTPQEFRADHQRAVAVGRGPQGGRAKYRSSIAEVAGHRLRLQAADLFGQQVPTPEVASRLRVSRQAVAGRRRVWQAGGRKALVSKGPGGATCRLDERQLAELEAELKRGPAAQGYDDQRWALARVLVLVWRKFRVSYTVPGMWYLLRRMGWSAQVPVRRAVERDQAAIEAWRQETWPELTCEDAARAGP